MQRRKSGQPHKDWKAAARKRLLADGWNTDLSAMPAQGRFQVLRIYGEVYRHMPDSAYVIEPMHGRMFVPQAWRPARKSTR